MEELINELYNDLLENNTPEIIIASIIKELGLEDGETNREGNKIDIKVPDGN